MPCPACLALVMQGTEVQTNEDKLAVEFALTLLAVASWLRCNTLQCSNGAPPQRRPVEARSRGPQRRLPITLRLRRPRDAPRGTLLERDSTRGRLVRASERAAECATPR
jgi:hypothetical protein